MARRFGLTEEEYRINKNYYQSLEKKDREAAQKRAKIYEHQLAIMEDIQENNNMKKSAPSNKVINLCDDDLFSVPDLDDTFWHGCVAAAENAEKVNQRRSNRERNITTSLQQIQQPVPFSEDKHIEKVDFRFFKPKANNVTTPVQKKIQQTTPVSDDKQSENERVPYSSSKAEGSSDNDRKSDELVSHEGSSSEASFFEPTCEEDYCDGCEKFLSSCHSHRYGKYCREVVMFKVNNSPADMTGKKCTEAFCKAYNRALDFCYFKFHNILIPKGFYYPTACLMEDLDHVIVDVEELQEKHINGEEKYTKTKYFERKDIIKMKMPTNHHQETSSSHEFCVQCNEEKENCHRILFAAYCKAHVTRDMKLFPTAMTCHAASKLFIKKYNSALHFVSYDKYEAVTHESFELPPNCLKHEMDKILEIVKQHHDEYNAHINGKEWRYASMDFMGFQIE